MSSTACRVILIQLAVTVVVAAGTLMYLNVIAAMSAFMGGAGSAIGVEVADPLSRVRLTCRGGLAILHSTRFADVAVPPPPLKPL